MTKPIQKAPGAVKPLKFPTTLLNCDVSISDTQEKLFSFNSGVALFELWRKKSVIGLCVTKDTHQSVAFIDRDQAIELMAGLEKAVKTMSAPEGS